MLPKNYIMDWFRGLHYGAKNRYIRKQFVYCVICHINKNFKNYYNYIIMMTFCFYIRINITTQFTNVADLIDIIILKITHSTKTIPPSGRNRGNPLWQSTMWYK